jgi:hypothetical protein
MFKVWSTGLGTLPPLPKMFGSDPPEVVGAITTGLGAGTSAAGSLIFASGSELRTTMGAAAGLAVATDSMSGDEVSAEGLGDLLGGDVLLPEVLLSDDLWSKFA